ncbi:MAG: hypothetical protein FD123_2666 [Bacteroidetes bacterium]|nr:MAG: hypothetical protein FD123_2666 [Bacteroidota bacterium]
MSIHDNRNKDDQSRAAAHLQLKKSDSPKTVQKRGMPAGAPVQRRQSGGELEANLGIITTADDGKPKFTLRTPGEAVTMGMKTTYLNPIRKLVNGASKITTADHEIVGGHMRAVKFGGNGDYPNVQPWSGAFERDVWPAQFETPIENELLAIAATGAGQTGAKMSFRYQVDDMNDVAGFKAAAAAAVPADHADLAAQTRAQIVEPLTYLPSKVVVRAKLTPSLVYEEEGDLDEGYSSEPMGAEKKVSYDIDNPANIHGVTAAAF